jgi:hypothetical protein
MAISLIRGPGLIARVHPPQQRVQKGEHLWLPRAIDIRCIAVGGALTGAVAGSDWVELGYTASDVWVEGGKLKVKIASAAAKVPVGVVVWDEGTVAEDAECWVRVFGEHPYAKVDGTAAVVIGDLLELGASKAVKFSAGNIAGVALEARSDAGVGAVKVLLLDPARLLAALAA